MTTRDALLNAFETDLNGSILRCDAFKHPVTGDWIDRNQNKQKNMPDLRSAIIEVEENPDGTFRLERHITFFWDADDDVKKNAQFYVVNRGQADEEATWLKAQNPKPPAPSPSFNQQVLNWLRDKVGQTLGPWTVKHVASATADQAAQTATGRALCEDDTGNAWLDVFLSRDAEDNIVMEVLEVTRLGA